MICFTYSLFALKKRQFFRTFDRFWEFLPKFDFTVWKIYFQVSPSWLNTAKGATKYRWRGKKGLTFLPILFLHWKMQFWKYWPKVGFTFLSRKKYLQVSAFWFKPVKRANIPKRQSKNKFGLSLPIHFSVEKSIFEYFQEMLMIWFNY